MSFANGAQYTLRSTSSRERRLFLSLRPRRGNIRMPGCYVLGGADDTRPLGLSNRDSRLKRRPQARTRPRLTPTTLRNGLAFGSNFAPVRLDAIRVR